MNHLIRSLIHTTAVAGAIVLAAVHPVHADGRPDGRHGFDFLLGKWNAHFQLLRRPLTGSKDWIIFDGTIVDRSVLGFVNTDEGVFYRQAGRQNAVTVRVYDAKTNQWSIYFGTDTSGSLALPATVGGFDENGIGRFYDRESYHGKPIVVRYIWTHTQRTGHFEQAFSTDGGKHWETNWISDLKRP